MLFLIFCSMNMKNFKSRFSFTVFLSVQSSFLTSPVLLTALMVFKSWLLNIQRLNSFVDFFILAFRIGINLNYGFHCREWLSIFQASLVNILPDSLFYQFKPMLQILMEKLVKLNLRWILFVFKIVKTFLPKLLNWKSASKSEIVQSYLKTITWNVSQLIAIIIEPLFFSNNNNFTLKCTSSRI